MTKLDLINLLNNKIPSNWKVKEVSDIIYVKKFIGDKFETYFPIIKCHKPTSLDFWIFKFTELENNNKFNIPNELVEDFLDVFIERCDKYLKIRKSFSEAQDDIFRLSKTPKIEIREYKIDNIIKSENQE
jgi:predicted DNA-binding protein (UPF0278 family)